MKHKTKKQTYQPLLILLIFPLMALGLSITSTMMDLNDNSSSITNSYTISLIRSNEYEKLTQSQKNEHDRTIQNKLNQYIREKNIENQVDFDLHKADIETQIALDSQLFVSQTLHPYDPTECTKWLVERDVSMMKAVSFCSDR